MKSNIEEIKNIIKSITWNWRALLRFEFLYKILGGILLFPLIYNLINFTLRKANIEYINLDNLKQWLLNPYTIPGVFIALLILGIYIMIEMGVIVQYFYSVKRKEKLGAIKLLNTVIRKSFSVIRPRNWLLLFFVMIIFPITSFTLTPGVLINLTIPEYIVDFFKEQGYIYIVYIIFLIIIEVIVFYMIYSIPIFFLEEISFWKACKKSYNMMKKNFFKTLLKYLLWIGAILSVSLFVCGIFLLFNIILFRYINYNEFSKDEFLISYISLKQYATFIIHILIFIGTFAFIMNNYFKYSSDEVETVEVIENKNRLLSIFTSVAELSIVFLAIGIYLDYQGNAFQMYSLMSQKQEIAAHRAGSTFAPENTLEALKNAINSNATYAEIDVQQSKDNKLIILHDTNFKRTTGVDKNVWDSTYDEIKTYDAGSYYSYEFKNAKIPTLEEMIQKANGKIKLMIEIKKNGHETNLEEDVVDLIKKYNFEEQCVIASMDLDTLHKVKELDKNIKTVYITALAYGDYYGIEDVDMFSIESTFVNRDVVDRIHQENKKVFVWTVNKDKAIKRMLSLSVDGIVTDNPELVAYYKRQGSSDIFIEDLIRSVFPDSNIKGEPAI